MLSSSSPRPLSVSSRLSALAATLLGCLAITAGAQAQVSHFEPRVGQEGKDVVWVPTPDPLVQRMLDMGDVKPGEFLIDLGSGDGRTVIAAARRGVRAHGIEYNPDMVELAKQAARTANVEALATFAEGDLFEADLSKADVITLFLLPSINERLSPSLLKLAPGTRIVSNSFRMGDWEADQSSTVDEGCTRWCTALLWVVPAQVEGNWQLDGQPLQLQQTYQRLEGTLGGQPLSNASLDGKSVAFTVGNARYVGTVEKDQMSGQVEGSGRAWQAARR